MNKEIPIGKYRIYLDLEAASVVPYLFMFALGLLAGLLW